MRKKKYDPDEVDKRIRRTTTRNYIIMGVSLVLMVICYYFVK